MTTPADTANGEQVTIPVFTQKADIRAFSRRQKLAGKTVAFVPTMVRCVAAQHVSTACADFLYCFISSWCCCAGLPAPGPYLTRGGSKVIDLTTSGLLRALLTDGDGWAAERVGR